MRIADYLMKTLADRNVDTAFLVTGGMAMHLNDALAGEPRLRSFAATMNRRRPTPPRVTVISPVGRPCSASRPVPAP